MHVTTNPIDNNAIVIRTLTRINVSDPQICKSSNSTLRKAHRYTISVLHETTKSLWIVRERTCTEFWVKVTVFNLRYKWWRTKCHAFQYENASPRDREMKQRSHCIYLLMIIFHTFEWMAYVSFAIIWIIYIQKKIVQYFVHHSINTKYLAHLLL